MNVVELNAVEKTFHTRHFFPIDEETRKRRLYRKRDVQAAKGISFGIAKGEIFGLLGPNGAGKTTTVKMICGLVKPDAGTVHVDGMEMERARKRALEKVGVVLEGTRTSIWPLTPLENLHYYGNLKNVTGKVLQARTHDLLDFIGLKEQKNVQVRHLSRGQKQKLAICIGLIADPDVLLLDEPTTGLDVQSSRAIKDKIIEMTRAQGKSVLVTTHDMHVAQELCDRIGIINHGELITCKPTEQLLDFFSDLTFVVKLDRVPGSMEAFTAIPAVISAASEDAEEGPAIVVRLNEDPEQRSAAFYELMEQLRAGGFLLRGVTQRQVNLEGIFLRLTANANDKGKSA